MSDSQHEHNLDVLCPECITDRAINVWTDLIGEECDQPNQRLSHVLYCDGGFPRAVVLKNVHGVLGVLLYDVARDSFAGPFRPLWHGEHEDLIDGRSTEPPTRLLDAN